MNSKNFFKIWDNFSKGTLLMFFSGILVNIFALVYQLFMIRKLSPTDYGTLNSLIALLALISVPAGTIKRVIMKFTSKYHGLDKMPEVGAFVWASAKKVLVLGLVLFSFFLFGSKPIASFLQITSSLYIIILGLIMFMSIILPVTLGALNGLQRFWPLAINMCIDRGFNLLLGVLFVSLGFRVVGALWGWFLAVTITVLVSYLPLREVIAKGKGKVIDFKDKYMFLFPVATMLFCFMALTNIDIILVKHFFTPLEAGYYAIAQMIGKIVFLLPQAIALVLFPKASFNKAQKKDPKPLLRKSLTYSAALCFSAALVTIVFPSLVLKIIAGRVNPECIPLVRVFSINMGFLALVGLGVDYFLSIHDFKFIPYMVFFIILEVFLIVAFHQSLLQVILLVTLVSITMFFVNLRLAKLVKQ